MKVEEIKPQDDGSAIVTVSLSMKDEVAFRKLAKKLKKPYSQAFVRKQLLEALQQNIADAKKEMKKKNNECK